MHSAHPTSLLRMLIIVIPALVLAACGKGSGQPPVPGTPQPTLTGVLVDSPVAGVEWKTSGGNSGLTTDSGEFEYVQPEAGTYVETIAFSIGDILLGTVPGIPFKGDRLYVSAVELTNSFAPTDRAATNMLVFIQSIDADGDPTTGITISEATREAAVGVFDSLDFDSLDFESLEEVVEVIEAIAPGNRVVTDSEALDHFYTTYAALGGTDTFDFPFPGYPPVGEDADEFELIFADEFNTGAAPNEDVWNYDLGYGPNSFGWGNDEWQLYTRDAENIRVEDGNLVITALCNEPCGSRDGSITSARITTNDKFEFRYGKVVARIKVPVGEGTWPAFWALGKDFPDVEWPRVGEIDFMEVFNRINGDESLQRTATSAMHWCDEIGPPVIPPDANCFAAGGRDLVFAELDTGSSLGDGFQVWEADWDSERVIVSINGIQYFELEIDPVRMEEFRRDFFLLLNVAVGGRPIGGGGPPPEGYQLSPQTMLVDYVRVYQRVGDITPPELTFVSIASDNADPSFAKLGDTVTVTLTANEPIVAPVVTIGGIAATTVTGSGTDWQASRVIAAGDDTDGSPIAFTIDYDDLAGNAGVTVSGTTDGSAVIADAIVPELQPVTIASNNANPAFATTGDVVTVTLTASEPIVEPFVIIGGNAATTVTGSGRNWQASREMAAGDDTGAETIAFSIDYADFAGNAGVPVTDTTDSSSVTVDTIAPTVAILGVPNEFGDLQPFTVTFQFSEPVSGFDVSNIVVTDADGVPNGVARDLVADSQDPSLFTATVTPTGFGDLLISVEAGAASDAAGNESEVPGEVPEVVNGLNPDAPLLELVSIRSTTNPDPNYAKAGDTVQVTFAATEAITQPTVEIGETRLLPEDVTNPTGDNINWTATRKDLASPGDPEPPPEGPIAFAISGFTAVDDGTAGYSTSVPVPDVGQTVIFDSIRPTLTIEGLPDAIQILDPIPVTFRFSEEVIGFDEGDVDSGLVNGSVSAFVAVDGAVYTAEITPNGAGNLTVSVAENAATDAAGNGNERAEATSEVGAFWGLVWEDDFEVTDPALLVNWTVRTSEPGDCPDPCDGQQEYRTDRVTVVDGVLTIEAADETGLGQYVSGIIDTRDKRALKYGRVEIDAVMPGNRGTLPSLRLLPVPTLPVGSPRPEYGAYGPWPQSGEIDIVNAPNLDLDNTLYHTLRYGLPEPEDTATTATYNEAVDPTVNTIEYAIEWADGEIRWFVDNVHVATQTKDATEAVRDNWYAYFEDTDGVFTLGAGTEPFDQDFFIVIGLGVGDNPDSFFPQTLKVDEVRVYECVNPLAPSDINACLTGNENLAPVDAESEPYVETLEVYTDAPATLDFLLPDASTEQGTLAPAAIGDATFSQRDDGGNIVWNVNVTSSGGVTMGSGASTRYFDLSGGGTAGEILFRMRVNSIGGSTVLSVGLDDRESGTGRAILSDVAAPGVWRNYSVKIADLLSASSLDIANIGNIFVLDASGGSADLDLDDIEIKVACRDVGGCEATPRSASLPSFEVYSQDFELLDAQDLEALGGPQGPCSAVACSDYIVFADVWGSATGDATVGTDIFLYSYGPFSAPNNYDPGGATNSGFSNIASGEGDADQGTQYLSVQSDYENADQVAGGACAGTGCTINTSVFREQTAIGADPGTLVEDQTLRVGDLVAFTFDAKSPFAGGISDAEDGNGGDFNNPQSASAFLKTLDPNAGYAATNDIREDMTDISNTEWATFTIELDLCDPLLEGQLFQYGFNTVSRDYFNSGVYYDNLEVTKGRATCEAP